MIQKDHSGGSIEEGLAEEAGESPVSRTLMPSSEGPHHQACSSELRE